jgi:hypothetical protein
VNDKHNVYRAYAAFCEKMSRDSQGADRKLSWARLAADWLALIRDSSSTDSPLDSTKNGALGTGLANRRSESLMADQPHDNPPDEAESPPER